MKKIIIAVLCVVATCSAFAQTTPPAVKDTAKVKPVEKPKPEFKLDMNQQVGVVMPLAYFNALLTSPEDFQALEQSEKVSAKQVSDAKAGQKTARAYLFDQLNSFAEQQKKTFQDTAGKGIKPPIVDKKVKGKQSPPKTDQVAKN